MNPLRITGRTWPGRSVAAAVAVALAHVPVIDAAIFRELPAAALAEMRGKFVAGRQVQYFGMTVTTRWAGSAPPAASQAGDIARVAESGPTHEVGLSLQVDNSGPQTRVSYSIGGTLGDLVYGQAPAAGQHRASVADGVVQAIQVKGSGNVVRNNLAYSVISAADAPVLDDSQVTSALPTDQTFRNGDMLTHFTTTNGVGFTIVSRGNQVTQRLGADPVTHHNQLTQVVQLQGDGQRVVNDLKLQVAFDNALSQHGGGTRFRADRSMSQL